jgi:hypothetical protein
MRTMLLRLAAPVDKSAELMAELGINAFDAQGEFIGMARLAGVLQGALSDMTDAQRQAALAQIFGQDAIRSASILYEQGEVGIRDWITATDDSGFAAETAARKLDNLLGDVEALTGSLETLAIESGGGANAGLRILAQGATALVNQFAQLPSAVSGTAVVLGGLSGVGLLAFAAFVKMRGAAANALDELRNMGPAGARAAGGLQRAAVWGGRAVAVFAGLQIAAAAVDAASDDLNPQIDAMAEGLARFARTGETSGEAARVLGDNFESLAESMRLISPEGLGPDIGRGIQSLLSPAEWGAWEGSVRRGKQELEALDQALAQLVSSGRQTEAATAFERLADVAEREGVSVARLRDMLPSYTSALETAGAGNTAAADQFEELAGSVQQVEQDVAALNEEFGRLFGIQMDLDEAQLQYKQGLADLAAELDDGATSLSLNTQAGRDNRAAVLDQITAVGDLRQANIDNGMSMDDANGKYDAQLDKIGAMLIERGFEEGAVRDLIGAYRDIPATVKTEVHTPGLDAATRRAEAYRLQLGYIPSRVTTEFNTLVTRTYGPGANTVERWGGIVHAQHGQLIPAHIATSPTVMYGERATGGEAYVPMNGNRDRSMSILQTAAGWYGATIADTASMRQAQRWQGSGGGGGGVAVVQLHITGDGSARADFIISEVRRGVERRGGDVQVVLGKG